jgi:hypothetical protein
VTKTCEHCGQEMAPDNPYYIGEKLGDYSYWEYWADTREGEQASVPGVGVVTVVAKSTRFGEDQGEDDRPAFIIFEIGGQFYRKNGRADSYGEVTWHGGFTHAVKKVVQTETWENA